MLSRLEAKGTLATAAARYAIVGLLTLLGLLHLLAASAAATLIGDGVNACGLVYSSCVVDPSPGLNTGGTLTPQSGVATVGAGLEFSFTSSSGNTTHTVDFGSDTLEIQILNNTGTLVQFTGLSDLGWVFTDLDSPIGPILGVSIVDGGTLPIAQFSFDSDRIDVNYAEGFGVLPGGGVSTVFHIAFVPEPATASLLGLGLLGMRLAGAHRRQPGARHRPAPRDRARHLPDP